MSDDTLTALLDTLRARRPGAPALIHDGRATSFAALDDLSRKVARGLAGLGVGPGDRVALWLPDVPAWLILFFACARLGAVAVALNTRFRGAEIGDLLRRSRAKVLALAPQFNDIDFAGILDDVDDGALSALETVIVVGDDAPARVRGRAAVRYDDLEATIPPYADDHAAPDTGCVTFTTSGTTNKPKLVLHNQASIVRHGHDVAAAFGYDATASKVLHAIPFCGVFGLSQAIGALTGGAALVLMPRFDASRAAQMITSHRITHFNGSDDMIARLLDATDEERPFPTIRFAGFGSFTPALHDIAARADARGLALVGLYGTSEIQALFAFQPPDADLATRATMGGRLVSPQARVRVRDPDSGALLGHGEIGELELRGPSLMAEYVDNPEATAAAFTEDGFFRSGDLGMTHAGGAFTFLSRMGDVLRLGGFLVNPQEIEDYVQGHAAVDGCQVVGADGDRGTVPVAFVIPAAGARFSESDIAAHCRKGLAKYKVPARIIAVDAFPVTTGPNGVKIQRAKLRDSAQALLADRAAS